MCVNIYTYIYTYVRIPRTVIDLSKFLENNYLLASRAVSFRKTFIRCITSDTNQAHQHTSTQQLWNNKPSRPTPMICHQIIWYLTSINGWIVWHCGNDSEYGNNYLCEYRFKCHNNCIKHLQLHLTHTSSYHTCTTHINLTHRYTHMHFLHAFTIFTISCAWQ